MHHDGIDWVDVTSSLDNGTNTVCGIVTSLSPFVIAEGCCAMRGDVDHDGDRDISDLTYVVDYMFRNGPPSPCPAEGDINGDSSLDISDLTYQVDYMFRGGPEPPGCS